MNDDGSGPGSWATARRSYLGGDRLTAATLVGIALNCLVLAISAVLLWRRALAR